MNRISSKIIHTLLFCMAVFLFWGSTCKAEEPLFWSNENTEYISVIWDGAALLTKAEELEIQEQMKPITDYGNVIFMTVSRNPNSAADCANEAYTALLGEADGTLFLIDMDNRMLYICSDGKLDQIITKAYAETITDNVYRFASDGEYFKCAMQTFDQIYKVLAGQKIRQPMKYICNFLLALILALSINFAWMTHCSRISRPTPKKLLADMPHYFNLQEPKFVYKRKSKYDSSSGGSSSGGGRVGGSGGGRSFGGGRRVGGGHRF